MGGGDCEDVLVSSVRVGVRGTVNREDEEAARAHSLHLTVFRAGGPVGTAIPLYDHALN